MKNYLFVFTTCFHLFWISSIHGQVSYGSSDKYFAKKYKDLIPEYEKIIASWYHYIKTQSKDEKFIVRSIFPETKVVTSKIIYKDKKCMVKHGEAIYWKDDGAIYKQGNFVDNKKEGFWIFYHGTSVHKSSEGNYLKDKRQGEWKEYNSNGKLNKIVNFIDDKLEGSFEEYDSIGVVTNKGEYRNGTIFTQTLKIQDSVKIIKPFYDSECKSIRDNIERQSCSDKSLLHYIYASIKYPPIAREFDVEGNVLVIFDILKDGSISNIIIPNGLCESIKSEVFHIVSNMPKWSPGSFNDKPVVVRFNLPVTFNLE